MKKHNTRRLKSAAKFLLIVAVFVGVYVALHYPNSPVSNEGRRPQTASEPSGKQREFGIATSGILTLLSDAELANWIQGMKDLGVTWVRYDMMWSHVQFHNSTEYDWDRIDRVVAATKAANIKTLAVISYTPEWARMPACAALSDKCPPENPADFARFAGEAAKRYGPQGIHHYEIWNEPNHKSFWTPAPDAVRYTDLLKQSSAAIRQEDSQAVILTGGLTGGGADSAYPVDFLQDIYDNGGGNSFDVVAMHPYTSPLAVLSPVASWKYMSASSPSIRSTLAAHGQSDKQVWVTEFGAPTMGSGHQYTETDFVDTHAPGDYVTEGYQSKLLRDAVADYTQYDWTGPFFWFTLYDAATNSTSTQDNFGLITASGARKPAFDVYRNLINSYKLTAPSIAPSSIIRYPDDETVDPYSGGGK